MITNYDYGESIYMLFMYNYEAINHIQKSPTRYKLLVLH